MAEKTIQVRVPWYELDRMIIESIDKDRWNCTLLVVNKVRCQCIERKWPVKEAEIVSRLLELVKLGTLAMTGDIWHRPTQSGVCLLLED